MVSTEWSTFHGDPARAGNAVESVVPPLKKIWEFSIRDGLIQCSPAVSDGYIYFGTIDVKKNRPVFYALSANSGNLEWEFMPSGNIWSSPTVSNGTVYFRTLEPDNRVFALDTRTGRELWQFQDRLARFSETSPLVANDKVCLDGTSLYMLDSQTGQIIWRDDSDGGNRGIVPAMSEGVLYAAHDNAIIAYDLQIPNRMWSLSVGAKITCGPVISDGFLYVCTKRCVLVVVNILTKKVEQSVQLPPSDLSSRYSNYESYPAIARDRLFIGTPNGNVYAMNSKDVTQRLWSFNANACISSSPVISGNVIYILAGDGTFYALNANRGELVWKYHSKYSQGNLSASPAICNGKVFIGWDKMYAFAPS